MQCCRDCWSAVRAIGEDLGAELGGFRGFGVFLGIPNIGGGEEGFDLGVKSPKIGQK